MKALLVALPSGKQIALEKERITIGRSKKNDIVSSDSHVSSTHCVLIKEGQGYFIRDLDSSNGTFINGTKIQGKKKLRNNDTVSLGQKAVAYQFRRYSTIVKSVTDFAGRPRSRMLMGAGLLLVLGLLVYFFIIRDWGKVDVRKALKNLQDTYGENIFPRDDEIISDLDHMIESVRREASFWETYEKRAQYKDLIEQIFSKNNIQLDFSYIAWVESHYDPHA
jgi:hypothetical protein